MIVKVKFSDGKSYQYHTDIEKIKIGQKVKVSGKRSDDVGEVIDINSGELYRNSRYGNFEIERITKLIKSNYSEISDFILRKIDDHSANIKKYQGEDEVVRVPNEIDGMKIVGIDERAFMGCVHLSSVVLPNSIEKVGESAFADCIALKSIVLPENLKIIEAYAFQSCTSLTSIDFPEGMSTIGYGSFENCSNLISLKLPESLAEIGGKAFESCTSLTSIDFPKGMSKIGEGSFVNCSNLISLKLPESLVEIGNYAFQGCENICEFELPHGLLEIGIAAFRRCSNIKSIILPDGITKLPMYSFSGCSALTSINLHENILEIGTGAFEGCTSITELILPSSLKKLGSGVFEKTKLKWKQIQVNKPSENEKGIILHKLIDGSYKIVSCLDLNIKKIDIPSNYKISQIGEEAFSYCNKLSSVEFHDGLTEIGKYAFYKCKNLSYISLPTSIRKIGDRAFSDCSNLKSISIPKEITVVGYRLFENIILTIESKDMNYDLWYVYSNHMRYIDFSLEIEQLLTTYDEAIFQTSNDVDNKIRGMIIRLSSPYNLKSELKSKFIEYVKKFWSKLDDYNFLNQLREKWFIVFATNEIFSKSNIEKFITYAKDNNDLEAVAYLMNYKEEHLGKSSKSYRL